MEHLTYKANQRGIEQGGRVRCVKAIAGKACRAGVEVGREGRVQAFKATLVQVLWDVGEGRLPGVDAGVVGLHRATPAGGCQPGLGAGGEAAAGGAQGGVAKMMKRFGSMR